MMPVDEPRPSTRRRTAGVWIAIVLVLLLVGGLGAALSRMSEWTPKEPLDPEGPAAGGARALVEVLRAQGVDVTVARTLGTAERAVRADGTLVILSTDPLSDETLTSLTDSAADVVLLDPRARDMRVIFDAAERVEFGDGEPVAAQCTQPDAERAGPISPGTLLPAGSDAEGCYPGAAGFGLVVRDLSPTSRIAAIDGRSVFTNDTIAAAGNAALALGLLGRHEHLVWYLPSAFDDSRTGEPTLGDLTPDWVTPVILLLLGTGVVAAIWRGRRFGPLVPENLPVTVRAAETMEGRARLYARSRDAAHALDALRLGALDRIAATLGLGPAASAAEIADAAAARLGAAREVVRGILIDTVPHTDSDLVAASDRLRDLEAAVRASVRIERNDP